MNVTNPAEILINDFVWKCEVNKGEIKLSTSSSLNREEKIGEVAKHIFDIFNLEFEPKDFKGEISENDINIHFQKSKESLIYNTLENYLLEEERIDNGLKDPYGYLQLLKNSNKNEINPYHIAGNQKKLIELAKVCAQTWGGLTAEYIDRFGITDEEALIEIAKFAAIEQGALVARHIKNFRIKDPEGLIEIAKLCALNSKTAENIKNFGIKDQKALIEIVKLCAQNDAAGTAANIGSFGIKDQKALIEIAKLCAQSNGRATALHIKKFGITNEAALIEIAKLCAQNDGRVTALFIKNFRINEQTPLNEAALIEIAELCAKNAGGGTAEFIKRFDIKDQQALIKIAKLCAQNDGGKTAEFIDNFEIKDKEELTEIAELCAKSTRGGTAEHIKKFGITDKQTLIKIAKLCAQNDGGRTAANIGNFEIEDKDVLIEIAKLCARNDGGGTAANIFNFEIEDQKILIKIAKLCAQNDPGGTAANIFNFEIENQVALIEIAKQCAQGAGGVTAENIFNFGIEDKAALIEIAKLCAQNDGGGTAEFIKRFEIEDQQTLIEIAKLCAKNNGMKTAEHIKKFGITNKQVLIEIAKLCAQNGGWDTTVNIRNFGMQNSEDFVDVIVNCFFNSNEVPTDSLFSFLRDNHGLFTLPINLNFSTFSTFEEISRSLTKWIEENFKETNFKKSVDDCSKNPDENLKKEKILLLQALLFLGKASLSEEQIKWMSKENILPAILSFGRPELRAKIYMHILEALKNPEYGGSLELILPRRHSHHSEILTRMLLGKLQCIEGMDEKLISEFFSQCYSRADSIFYEGKNCQILTETLLKLLDNPQRAKSLLEKLYSEAGILLQKEKGAITPSVKQKRSLDGKKAEANRLAKMLEPGNKQMNQEFAKRKRGLDGEIDQLEKIIKQKRGALVEKEAEAKRLAEVFLDGQIDKEFAKEKEILDKEIAQLKSENKELTNESGIPLDKKQEGIRYRQGRILAEKEAEVYRLEEVLLGGNEQIEGEFVKRKEGLKKEIEQLKSISEEKELILEEKKAEANRLEQVSLAGDEQIEKEFVKEKEILEKEIAQLEKKHSPGQIETSILKSAKTLLSILLFNDDKWTLEENSLQEILESLLSNRLPLGKVKDFIESYNSKFTSSRNPAALSTYVAKLSSLKDADEVLSYFGMHVTSFLNGSFENDRYSLENNTHLTKINQIDPKLLDLWKQKLAPITLQIQGGLELQAVDTDDFMTILLVGTDVGSCQRVDGDPNLNKGLLGYMDGKNRMLVLQDAEGRTVARCILRLLVDENDKPVLFRERLYPETLSAEQESALNALAKRRAEHLSLPLLYQGVEKNSYKGGLKSLEGPMPWEYCDGADGVQKNGIYAIKLAHYLT